MTFQTSLTQSEVEELLPFLTAQELAELDKLLPIWTPLPGPQTQAIECQADELFYGGAAGGGKTDLLLGSALTQHSKSVIFRRVYPNLKAIIDRSIELQGTSQGYNRTEKVWNLPNQQIEFGSIQYEDNKNNWRGRPHDLYGFDEITEFTQLQYQFVIAWNRSTDPAQRCRVICTGNPPMEHAGSWVIDAWGPWLDEFFPNPAKAGELRWYYHIDDKLVWSESGDAIEVEGETVYPRSRTFIPARLSDNPYLLHDHAYLSVLQSLPEPMRSQLLKGDFTVGTEPNPWQVIPTEWVREAQRRWVNRERPDVPLTAVGLDPARGGRDKLAMVERYDNWFAEVKTTPGASVRTAPLAMAFIQSSLKKEPGYMNIDVIGIGSSVFDHAKEIYQVSPINAAEGSDFRDRSGKLKARNVRAEYYWRMREALDPENGDDIALPPGNEILADLCAATYKITSAGITIEPKEDIKERIGRSPDVGEAILLAHMVENTKWQEVEFLHI